MSSQLLGQVALRILRLDCPYMYVRSFFPLIYSFYLQTFSEHLLVVKVDQIIHLQTGVNIRIYKIVRSSDFFLRLHSITQKLTVHVHLPPMNTCMQIIPL